MKRFWGSGDAFVWLSAGATAIALILILGVLYLVASGGLGMFWPAPLVAFRTAEGNAVLGEIRSTEAVPGDIAASEDERRLLVKAGNRRLYGEGEFVWLRESHIVARLRPGDATLLEREEYGDFIGFVTGYARSDSMLATGDAAVRMWRDRKGELEALRKRVRSLERTEVGRINRHIEQARLELRALDLEGAEAPVRRAELRARIEEKEAAYAELTDEIATLRSTLEADVLHLRTFDDRTTTVGAGYVYRLIQPNRMGFPAKIGTYVSRFRAFVTDAPREANLAGGIYPAIFGTVFMTFLMTLFVVPLGAVAGLYLREYAKQGVLVRAVRIAVNNLAGVPSIVFGVFGLGFFIYTMGGWIDQRFYPESLPTPTFGTGGILWSALTLALLTVPVVIVATEEGLAAVPRAAREGSLALGATKWETTWRVVLPAASPGILTGVILAIARAAGEVAPLMLTGAVKTATDLPVDGTAPFLHLDRKFMHLGFHIYDVGFQSPNVEAAKPMVYMTTLLLVGIVVLLNVAAMWIRNRLRNRYRSASF